MKGGCLALGLALLVAMPAGAQEGSPAEPAPHDAPAEEPASEEDGPEEDASPDPPAPEPPVKDDAPASSMPAAKDVQVFGEDGAPPMLDQVAARELRRQALRLVQSGKVEEGCKIFAQAMEAWPDAATALNIGRCHLRFDRVASAWAYFYRALALNQQVANPADRETRARRLEYAIEQLQPRLPKVELVLGREPPEGFSIRHGDKSYPIGVLGKLLPIDPGEATITAEAPGFVPDTHQVTFEEGKTTTIEFRLQPIPPEPPPVKMIEKTSIPLWVWVTAGVGVVSAGVSIGAFVDMRSAIDDASACDGLPVTEPCALTRAQAQDEEARANRDLGLGIGFGVGAVGLLTASLVGGLVGETELIPDTAVRATPLVGATFAGLGLEGSF